MFSPESGVVVYDRDHWWSDSWDQLETGRDYDFNKPFFAQFADLMKRAPLPNLGNSNCVNSEYGNHNANLKDCYLVYASYNNENLAYVNGGAYCKDSMDLYKGLKSIQCYENVLCSGVNRVFFSHDSEESIQSEFLLSCLNMQNSLACVNMRNGSNCAWNHKYSKEEYAKIRSQYDFGSYKQQEDFKRKFSEFILKYPRKYAMIIKSVNCTGDAIENSKNCQNCFDIYTELEDCKYSYHAVEMKDGYDTYGAGGNSELIYEGIDIGVKSRGCKFGAITHGCHDTTYTYSCHGSSNLFGCVGLRSKQYCILNKQYSKEEYTKLVPKIIEHMKAMPYVDVNGRTYGYGEFFPIELSPFAYNETIAQEYMPLTESDAAKLGYSWKQQEAKHHSVTIVAEDLPDHIKDVPDSILEEVIECGHKGECNQQCTGAFKLISSELQFYRNFNLALPRLCPNCRHYERLAKRNPFKLWKRKCQCGGEGSSNGIYKNISSHTHGEKACDNEFQTPYAPDRLEIVYCEQCYNAEVV